MNQNGIASDADGRILTWQWESPQILFNPGSQNAIGRFDDNGDYDITLTVTDSQFLTSTITKTVTVLNLPPTVNFGADETLPWGEEHRAVLSGAVGDPSSVDDDTA